MTRSTILGRQGSQKGGAVVAIWNDILPDSREDFFEWHNREHIPERVSIPGFLRGRRYVGIDAQPEFFTLYDTKGMSVVTSPAYLEKLQNPTPWTARAVKSFTALSRSLCSVESSFGSGSGGLMMTVRFEVAKDRETEMLTAVREHVSPNLIARPGIVRVRLCLAELEASSIKSAEKKGHDHIPVPGWILLVEGGAEAGALKAACDEIVCQRALVALGAIGIVKHDLYCLQSDLFADG